jgi:carboxymethylenebutenolidase
MGEMVSLTAGDGHEFAAYRASPKGKARGGLVVIQEIFGVNGHIREVVDGFAADGYDTIAPALFDRKERGVELGYDTDGVAAGRALRMSVGWDGPVADIAAAGEAVSEAGKVGIIGYCWGGSLVWLAAARLELSCAVAFYGGQISQFRGEPPQCPIELHFGENDAGIPPENRALIAEWQPHVPIHLYPAGHGFTCDHRPDYHAESSALGRDRSLAMFAEHIG